MKQKKQLTTLSASLGLLFSCGDKGASRANSVPDNKPNHEASQESENLDFLLPSALQLELAKQSPVQAKAPSDAQKKLAAAIDEHYQRSGTQRYYVHLDKPLYKPGETIWYRLWELQSSTLTTSAAAHGVTVKLISPKGATVLEKRVRMGVKDTFPANDFILPESVQGGEYTLRITSDKGASAEKKLIVSQYQAPRIKKKAEFLRKAYGPGDKVSAALSVHRATGEALANKKMTAIVQVDSAEVARFPIESNSEGNAIVKFTLPSSIRIGDGLLTVLVEDGGVTESLQKRIPITLKNISVEMYPEGGDLVAGLPGRIYFAAKNSMGKAADISGHIEDSQGKRITDFRSFHGGLGRYEFTPKAGESYFAIVDRPSDIKGRYLVPTAKEEGCSLQALDNYEGSEEIKVGVWCTQSQTLISSAVLREKRLGDYSFAIESGKANVLSFPVPLGSQGAVRVTLFDDKLSPMAERLIYRGLGKNLKISVSSDRDFYAPRDQVELSVRAEDLSGNPVEAELSVAVVDDTVLSFADDKTAHLLSRMYLESEMPGQEIEEPNFYFSDKPKAAAGIDLVMGTQGWRRFAWKAVLAPPPAIRSSTDKYALDDVEFAPPRLPMALAEAEKKGDENKRPGAMKAAPEPAAPAEKPIVLLRARPAKKNLRDRREMVMSRIVVAMEEPEFERDEDWDGEAPLAKRQANWAKYREFPTPNYSENYSGPRTDFRETIHWAPRVQTNTKGIAKLRFPLNDAITSFRVKAEGVSQGGLPGRVEHLVTSKLPVSLAVKMPLEVSKGDEILLPVSLANETNRPYAVAIRSEFGAAFQVRGGIPTEVTLKAGERKSFFADLLVVGNGKKADEGLMRISMDTSNLKDEVERRVSVVPLGFPQEISLAGVAKGTIRHEFNITGVVPDTIRASLQMYPSPLATMVSGTQAIIREPYGCFEQASSANYPNIMVLDYLEKNDAAEPALVQKTMGHLDKGYKMLTGYESPQKGFEWFGGDPGHEALTAYGLMEFVDMSKVFGQVDQSMVKRTAAWLKSRRDGKGGFKRNSRALDSFGKASEEVTDSYISYALSQSGDTDLAPEIARQKKTAVDTKDPYVLALAANTLVNMQPTSSESTSALKKLAAMQGPDGAFKGADHSITRSGGVALELETTSLAVMALLKGGGAHLATVRKSVEWINKMRSGAGGFGSTQSTVLALSALSDYAEASRVTQSGGVASVIVNGEKAGTLRFEKGHKDALIFEDIAASLKPGKNVIELKLDSENPLPYSIGIEYRSKMPASASESPVRLFTKLSRQKVPVGEGVKMTVSLSNTTDKGQPMTLARVGIPGGLTFQTWQLKELMDKKIIDFYETREREVVLYFRSLAPNAEIEVPLELIARVPGKYLGPASQAYLYYTDEFRQWSEPNRILIER